MTKKKIKQKPQQRRDQQSNNNFQNKKSNQQKPDEDFVDEEGSFLDENATHQNDKRDETDKEGCPHIEKLSINTNLHRNSLKLICQVKCTIPKY